MTVEIAEKKRWREIDSDLLADSTQRLLESVDREGVLVSLYLTDDVEIHQMNRRFRHVDRTTDVLSFPEEPEEDGGIELGEIVISVETAGRQAQESGQLVIERLIDLVAHGILHLLGFDHHGRKRAAWRREERRLVSAREDMKNCAREVCLRRRETES